MPKPDIDQDAISLLDDMRASRDKAARYRETLNDEAFQLELAANDKRALAAYMTTEINEGIPIADDAIVTPATTSTTSK